MAIEMTDEMFERVTNLAFENGYRMGYEQAIVDSQKAVSRFSAQALEKLNDYRLTNINRGAKMDEEVE